MDIRERRNKVYIRESEYIGLVFLSKGFLNLNSRMQAEKFNEKKL